jgi:hypothetical protein
METTTRPACTHDWQPIPGWYARYRCTLCHAIGCKFGVVQAKHVTRSNEIQPYRCEVRHGGERCNAPAVSSWYGKKFRCAEHRHGAHAARVRRQVAAAKSAEAQVVVASDETSAARRVEEPSTSHTDCVEGIPATSPSDPDHEEK